MAPDIESATADGEGVDRTADSGVPVDDAAGAVDMRQITAGNPAHRSEAATDIPATAAIGCRGEDRAHNLGEVHIDGRRAAVQCGTASRGQCHRSETAAEIAGTITADRHGLDLTVGRIGKGGLHQPGQGKAGPDENTRQPVAGGKATAFWLFALGLQSA